MKKSNILLSIILFGQLCLVEAGEKSYFHFLPSIKTRLLQLFPKTRRESLFFLAGITTAGITFITFLPKILRTIRENLKMPWLGLEFAWREEYQQVIKEIGTFSYQNRTVMVNIVHLFPKEEKPEGFEETYEAKIRRTKIAPRVPPQQKTAILFLPGLGDVWQLMAPAQHQELFPTAEFYVAQFPDSQLKRTLKTTVGGIDEALIALFCLRYLAMLQDNHQDRYERIIIFGESRGGAVAVLMKAFLDNWDTSIQDKSDLQYDYKQILNNTGIWLNAEEVAAMRNKLKQGGFVLFSPLESYTDVARLIASELPTKMFQKIGRYALTAWAASNLTYFDPNVQKDPVDVLKDWSSQNPVPTFYSPTSSDDVLGNETNNAFNNGLGQANDNKTYYLPHQGIHIKMQDPDVSQKLWNFMHTSNPDLLPEIKMIEQ